MELADLLEKEVVYRIPGMESVPVQADLTYKQVDELAYRLDIYRPVDAPETNLLPAVIFIHGDAASDVLATAKDWGQFRSWGRLAAMSGMVGVTFNHRSTNDRILGMEDVANDVTDAIAYIRLIGPDVGIDPERICLWACSAGVPYLQAALDADAPFIKCLVAYYGMMDLRKFGDELPSMPPRNKALLLETFERYSLLHHLEQRQANIPPTLIAKGELDHPAIMDSIEAFMDKATEFSAPVKLYVHAKGQHAFELLDDVQATHEIVQRTLEFMREHLAVQV